MGSIGRYRIVKKLATGGMAEVYLAKVAGPGGFEKLVVVKQILPQLADSELYVKMFLEEARLAAQLDHPNIVHVFDFGEVEGSYFLAMEYVEGANLRHVLRWAFKTGHVVSPALAARIISLACEGLAYAHQFMAPGSEEVTKLVHRDVSPENIMLSRTGAVKLLDFGVAKVTSEDNRSKVGSLKGKIAYMPPEQLKGGNIDRRVDIYALGIVLYQALCGKRPYGQATDVALIQAILNEEPVPLLKHRLDLPDTLLEIVTKAMQKKPEDRFQTCEDLRDALDAYVSQEGKPPNAAQIAQLVAAYQAGTMEATKTSAGAGTSGSSGVSHSGGSSAGGSMGGSHGGSNAPLDKAPLATPAEPSDAGLEGVAPKKAASDAKSLWPTGWKFGKSKAALVPGEQPPPPSEAQASPPAPDEAAPASLAEAAAVPTAERPAVITPEARGPAVQGLRGVQMKTTPGTPGFAAPAPVITASLAEPAAAPAPNLEATTPGTPSPAVTTSRRKSQVILTPAPLEAPPPRPAVTAAPVEAPPPPPPRPAVTAAPVEAPPPRPSVTAAPVAPVQYISDSPSQADLPVAAGTFAPPVLTPSGGTAPVPVAPRAEAHLFTPPAGNPATARPSGGMFDWNSSGAPLAVAHQGPVPQAPPPARKSSGAIGLTGTFEALRAPAAQQQRADDPHATRAWSPTALAAEPVRAAFREALRTDRSSTLLRKLPAVISRLTDVTPQIPWSMYEAFCGVLDTALLSDDHAAVVRVLERATQRPGPDARFASLVAAELGNPMRMAWLVERLRSGLPADVAGLRSWLVRIGPQVGPLLLSCLEMSEPGAAQELFAEALATAIPVDATGIIGSLKEPKLRDVAALSFALERSGANERAKVFNRLIGRREVPLQVEILTGRARARGADALVLLEGALGDKSDEIRRRAIKLVGELCGMKGHLLLQRTIKDASFETRGISDRALYWTAAFECGGDSAVVDVEQVLGSKPSLLNKKKVIEAKLAVIEGLGRSKADGARSILERVASDRGQGDEVQSAAVAALEGARRTTGEHSGEHKAIGEWRVHLMARICLDFVMLARTTTTIDIMSGLVDSAIERFRDGVRQLLSQDGKLQLVCTPAGPTINGTPVNFGPMHEKVAPAITAALQVRDLQGFAVDAMLPAAEFKSLLIRAFDVEGARERTPHIKAFSSTGVPLMTAVEPLPPVDPTARSRELFALVVRWLSAQRDNLRSERPLELVSVDAAVDEWARIIDSGTARFLGLMRWPTSDAGALVHAANTALISMAFAHDLGLGRSALREAAELALILGVAEAAGKTEQRPPPGEPNSEEQRFYAAGLVLTNRVNRLGTSVAVGTVEAGMTHSARGGPGLLASIHALAKTFDGLTAGAGAPPSQALEAMNSKLRARFSPDLVGLFTQWAFAQGAHS